MTRPPVDHAKLANQMRAIAGGNSRTPPHDVDAERALLGREDV